MGSRYVWSRYSFEWALGQYTDVYTAPWDKFSSYPDPSSSYKITSTGKYQLGSGAGGSLTLSILTGKNTPASNWYSKYLIGGSGDYLAERLTDGAFWCRAGSSYIAQGSTSGDVVCGDPNETVTIGSGAYARAKFRLYGPPQASRGSFIDYVSSANIATYPDNDVSGDYYYYLTLDDYPGWYQSGLLECMEPNEASRGEYMPEKCTEACPDLTRLEQQMKDLMEQNGADHKELRDRLNAVERAGAVQEVHWRSAWMRARPPALRARWCP